MMKILSDEVQRKIIQIQGDVNDAMDIVAEMPVCPPTDDHRLSRVDAKLYMIQSGLSQLQITLAIIGAIPNTSQSMADKESPR